MCVLQSDDEEEQEDGEYELDTSNTDVAMDDVDKPKVRAFSPRLPAVGRGFRRFPVWSCR